MKIQNIVGEYGFKGLLRMKQSNGEPGQRVWFPTPGIFFSLEDIRADFPEDKFDIRWPVEFDQDGSVYVPDASELV